MSTETAVAPQWVAVYLGRAVTYSSKEQAERLSTPDRIALLPVAFDPKELSDQGKRRTKDRRIQVER
jgi:hypothetical protein